MIRARIEVTTVPIDRHGGTEHLLDRVPCGGDQEYCAEPTERTETTQEQQDDDGAKQDQNERTGKTGGGGEHSVADLELTLRDSVCGRSDGLLQVVDPGPLGSRYATLAYMTGLPSGPLISACQALRTAAFTGAGSGMYSRLLAMLSPLP